MKKILLILIALGLIAPATDVVLASSKVVTLNINGTNYQFMLK